MPEDPAFPGLPEPQQAPRVASWDESAAACSPMTRARMVGEVCRQGAADGLDTAGACRTGVQEIAVVSSQGVRAYHAGTFAGLIITTRSDTSAGWAKGGSWKLEEIDYPLLAREAVDKAVRGRNRSRSLPGNTRWCWTTTPLTTSWRRCPYMGWGRRRSKRAGAGCAICRGRER